MKNNFLHFHRRIIANFLLVVIEQHVLANPTGLSVPSGSAMPSIQQTVSQLTITVGNNAVLNWQHFNIAAGESTIFNQPSAASIVWNRINDQNPSQIYGSLQANGVVVLLNSSGFYFGPNSFVSAAGLVVSTANCAPPQNGGGAWVFNGPPPLKSIVNYGQIKIGNGGDCFLIADQVKNYGDIEAPGGSISLAAGQTVTLSERPDGRGMSMNVTLPQGSVDNYGNLIADGGTIALNARVVNQDGFIQANSVQNKNGIIELVASDSLSLGADSKINANGDNSADGSAGGQITLKSASRFSDVTGSEISVAGGANGGNGGEVEISAPVMPAIQSRIDGHAQPGAVGGQLLLDPDYIVLDTYGGDSAGSGTVAVGDSSGSTLDLNVNSAFVGFSQITLQAAYDITLADYTSWNLSASTGQTTGQLVLEAGRNLIFGNNTALYDQNNWSIALYAGVTDFANKIVAPGAGSIYLNAFDPNNPGNGFDPNNPGSGYIATAAGSVTLVAGQDITVGTGYVNTTGGGSITAQALAGSIDTGGYAQGYGFQSGDNASQGYFVGANLGGISTLAGGDVNLIAGGNVQSLLPGRNGYHYDGNFYSSGGPNADVVTAGAGAYGSQAGDVTIVAGGDVTGNYVVANGTGRIVAGAKMDANGNPLDTLGNPIPIGGSGYVTDPNAAGSAGTSSSELALNLIKGGWNVMAAQDITLQEVRNPNGTFNTDSGGAWHAFDYAPSDYVNLTAGNLVDLGGTSSSLPRLNTFDNLKVPVIYPGILNIVAGAGGVVLDGDSTYNQLILFPSALGGLTIDTTGGGSLVANLPALNGTPQIFNLIVSDSGRSQYNSVTGGYFGLNDHAATPVHMNSELPVQLNISGDLDGILLGSPESAQINVVGNINNSRFQGMNLNAADVTSITVGQAAKLNLENSHILDPATDGGLTVGGNINNRGAFTSIDLSTVSGATTPDLASLAQAVNNTINGLSIPSVTLATSFFYNPVTKVLTYQNIPNVSLANVLTLLQNLTIQKVDQNGVPLWSDPPDDTVPVTTTVSVLDAATAAALLAEYNSLGPVPANSGGFTIGGGGKFNITAANMDLGTTTGIQSKGVGLYQVAGNYPLASLFSQGADININLTGNLNMYSTAIASLNGGNISLKAGGDVNVGSSDFSVSAQTARGIYTTGLGNISIIADGNINVNGSRIAAYEGGNVTVESLHGDINAGSGGSGYVVVQAFTVNPATHTVTSLTPTIPGSGILATTFPSDAGQAVGNILVETPNGSINASAGGIVQLPLNGVNTAKSIVEVLAGYELRDNSGKPVDAAGISSGTPVQVSDNGNILASGSGVIGSTVDLVASGNIAGVIFARNNINLNAQQNVSVTALAQGSINVNSGGTISGTIIGVGGISASGGSIDANLESNSSISGDTSGSKGLAQGTAANATANAASASDQTPAAAKSDASTNDDPLKKNKGITLARKISRVTVLLPGQN